MGCSLRRGLRRYRADGEAHLEHSLDGRCSFCGLFAVAVDEVIALEGHAVLDSDAAAECLDALDVAVADCFAMVEEPA